MKGAKPSLPCTNCSTLFNPGIYIQQIEINSSNSKRTSNPSKKVTVKSALQTLYILKDDQPENSNRKISKNGTSQEMVLCQSCHDLLNSFYKTFDTFNHRRLPDSTLSQKISQVHLTHRNPSTNELTTPVKQNGTPRISNKIIPDILNIPPRIPKKISPNIPPTDNMNGLKKSARIKARLSLASQQKPTEVIDLTGSSPRMPKLRKFDEEDCKEFSKPSTPTVSTPSEKMDPLTKRVKKNPTKSTSQKPKPVPRKSGSITDDSIIFSECPICPEGKKLSVTSSPSIFYRHLCTHIPSTSGKKTFDHSWSCPVCPKGGLLRPSLYQHLKLHANYKPLTCPWVGCEKSFMFPSARSFHLKTHGVVETTENRTKENMKLKKNQEKNMKMIKNRVPIKEKKMKMIKNRVPIKEKKMKMIKNGVPIKEKKSRVLPETPEPARKELKSKDGRHICPTCGKKCTDTYKLNIHIRRVHTKERAFHCDVCDTHYLERYHLIRHRTTVIHLNMLRQMETQQQPQEESSGLIEGTMETTVAGELTPQSTGDADIPAKSGDQELDSGIDRPECPMEEVKETTILKAKEEESVKEKTTILKEEEESEKSFEMGEEDANESMESGEERLTPSEENPDDGVMIVEVVDEEEETEEKVEKERREEVVEKKLHCPFCLSCCTYSTELEEHISSVHYDDP